MRHYNPCGFFHEFMDGFAGFARYSIISLFHTRCIPYEFCPEFIYLLSFFSILNQFFFHRTAPTHDD